MLMTPTMKTADFNFSKRKENTTKFMKLTTKVNYEMLVLQSQFVLRK